MMICTVHMKGKKYLTVYTRYDVNTPFRDRFHVSLMRKTAVTLTPPTVGRHADFCIISMLFSTFI